jgi:7-cyano-7-deazaguanine synthase
MELKKHEVDAIVVFSGGLDSTTLVYDAINHQDLYVDLVSFNYGQRHKKELEYAARTATKLNLRHDIVDLSSLTPLLAESGSSLVSEEEVPEGHYAADNMAKTIVPNRNMIMLSIAVGIAVSRGAEYVLTAVHAGDHAVYPDCRPEFIGALSYAAAQGNEDFGNGIKAPYVMLSKADIARKAIAESVPLEDTWSCYKGGELHCGKCGTCVERLEAISEANGEAYDQTKYEDKDYWRTVTNKENI